MVSEGRALARLTTPLDQRSIGADHIGSRIILPASAGAGLLRSVAADSALIGSWKGCGAESIRRIEATAVSRKVDLSGLRQAPLSLENLSVRSAFHSGPLVVELVSRD